EQFLVGLVRKLGVCDRELALEVVMASQFIEPPVSLRVDARNEEGRDRGHCAQVAAVVTEPPEPAQIGLRCSTVALKREQQRDVDGDPRRDRLLYRLETRLGAGNLDE